MKTISKLVMTLSVIVLSTGAFAFNTKTLPVDSGEPTTEPLSVKYIGQDEGYLIFRVVVKSDDYKPVSFVLNNKAEGELYTKVYKTDRLITFKVEKRDNQELDFNLVVNNKSYSKSFVNLLGQQVVATK